MNSSKKKVEIPLYEEAPVVVIPRFKQPKVGIYSFLTILLISLVSWWIFFDPRFHSANMVIFANLFGNFGLMAVIWASWFENWPLFNKLDKIWKIGLIGTLINLLIIIVLIFGILPFFHYFYSHLLGIFNRDIAFYVSASIFATLGASSFSFGVLWNAGTMYWPFIKFKQPKRGIYLWIIGSGITFFFWFFFFFFTGNSDATVIATSLQRHYYSSLGWTQWTLFFVLLTIIVYKYYPWTKLAKKQPYIGILAFIVCFFLGLLVSAFFPFLVPVLFDPLFFLLGHSADVLQRIDGWYKIGVSYPTFLILTIIFIIFFLKSWFEKFKFWNNLFLKTIMIFIIGTLSFLLFTIFSPLLIGISSNIWEANPLPFLFYLLWLESLYIYIWKKFPFYSQYTE